MLKQVIIHYMSKIIKEFFHLSNGGRVNLSLKRKKENVAIGLRLQLSDKNEGIVCR